MFSRSLLPALSLIALNNVAAAAEHVPTPSGKTKYSAKVSGQVYKGNGKKEVERRQRLIAEGKIKVDA